jgi:adhesin/invasin
LTEFPAPLRAKVTDVGGNPVPNATVTFTVPSSGASAAFAGPETGETGLDGIAISPTLIANDIPGSFAAAASTPGLPPSIAFALTNLPALSSVIVAAPNSLAFKSETGLGAPPNQAVQITSAGGSSVNWTATSTASWLSTTSNSGPTPGSLSIKADPTGLAPGTYTGTIRLTASDGSPALILVTHTVSAKPALVPASPQLVFLTTSNTVVPGAKTLAISSTSRAIPYNIRTEVSTPSNGTWLKVAQTQGGTPSEIAVAANPAGLTDGVYDGSVVLTPTEPGLTPLSVPVTLIVGCGQGGCQLQPRILSIVNSASFRPGGAPGAAMTIFGTALSSGIREAQSYPLPTQLESTTVTVNGVAAPLFYVSPTQINFQMPANAPLTGTTVVVNNGGLSGARALQGSASEPASLAAVDPALYVTPNGRAAARNADYSLHTALTPLPAGAYVLLFMNGQGAVTPAVADGTAASANPLSIINAPVQVTIGGKPAQVVFQGLTPGLAALGQINAIIPEGLSPGNQPVVITINGVSSNAGLITVR